jgi:hypothetical protein
MVLLFCSCDSHQNGGAGEKQFPGLIGGWYKSVEMKRLAESESLNNLHKVWDGESNHGNNWSGQWEGYITPPVSGNIMFHVTSNREVELGIAGERLLGTGEGLVCDSSRIRMKMGRAYPIHLIYRQRYGKPDTVCPAPFFTVSWDWKGAEREIVPSTALYYTVDQDARWNQIGENYPSPFRYTDTVEFLLDPVRIKAPELAKLDFSQSTGGLPVVNGVETFTVCRANREDPENAEGLGYTYQHHQDVAVWKGRMYVGWNTCEADEDTWPSRELISTSEDGKTWTRPVEMFPRGISTPLRMYFFLAPNGRMLVIAGLRENHDFLTERKKSRLVVREIHPDHSLGEVYTMRNVNNPVPHQPPAFETSSDQGFVEACRQLLADHLYLSQQDYGNLLDPADRMEWFNPGNWKGSEQLKDMAAEFGKAMCFFQRKDGTLVGISKFRWVTTSSDGGETWAQPVRPKSLVTGGGKVWGQSTSDGRYVLLYNPHPDNRWPLIMLTSEYGITFSHPRSVNGQLPEQRYVGKFKGAGVSYPRGLSHWNNDGSWKDEDLWLIYSLNKEDILISRIPVHSN